MSVIEFDTHKMIEALKAGKMQAGLAEAVTYAIRDIAMSNVATKHDLDRMTHSMTVRFGLMLASGLAVTVAVLGALISIQS